jgi:hypothetical protein
MILELFALTVENMAKLNKANGVLKYKLFVVNKVGVQNFKNKGNILYITFPLFLKISLLFALFLYFFHLSFKIPLCLTNKGRET